MATEEWNKAHPRDPTTGRFIKRIAEVIEEVIQKYYVYLISFDYKKRGKKGMHPFHAEVMVQSPTELDENEVIQFALDHSDDFYTVLAGCEMAVKGVEERIGFLPNKTYKMLKYKH